MIDSNTIYKKANHLVQRYRTRDTLALAEAIGIDVIYTEHFKGLLGMYAYIWRRRVMFLNARMDEHLMRMVAGHEMAHDIYHRDKAKEKEAFAEHDLFLTQNRMEYEANAFASHILIDTEECLEYARSGYTVTQIAQATCTETNLVLIKIKELNRLGYDLRLPMEPRSDFFKNMRAD